MIPDADDAPTPRESRLASYLGQLRELLRHGLPVSLVVVWRTPHTRTCFGVSPGLGCAEAADLLIEALAEIWSQPDDHAELSEISEVHE